MAEKAKPQPPAPRSLRRPPPAAEAPAAPAEPAPAEPAEPAPAEPPPVDLTPPAEGAPGAVDELPLAEEPVAEDIAEVDAAEVVVTVDRRTKNLQDYSGTASAFSETALTGLGITTVRDLAVTVPGLQSSTVDSGTSLFIRGIGSDNDTELGDRFQVPNRPGPLYPRHMSSRKTEAGGLLGALENPESARLVGEILEGLRRLSGQMGGAQPVIDALAQSFALMPNAGARGEYDQLRLELIRYLRSLDDGGSPSGSEKQVELERSPDVSAGDLEAFSRALLATAKAPKAKS